MVKSDAGPWDLLDSTCLLALPCEAAEEITAAYQQVIEEVTQFFNQYSGNQGAWSSAFERLSQAIGWVTQQGCTLQLLPILPLGFGRSAGNAAFPVPGPAAADPVNCYAFERFFRPFASAWAIAMPQDAGQAVPPAGSPAAQEQYDAVRRLLEYLIDRSMWNCLMLLLSKVPALAQHALEGGLEVPRDYLTSMTLRELAQQSCGNQAQAAAAGSGSLLSGVLARVSSCVNDAAPAAGPAEASSLAQDSSSWSMESATEILRVLAERELQRQQQQQGQHQVLWGDQEYLVQDLQQEVVPDQQQGTSLQVAAVAATAAGAGPYGGMWLPPEIVLPDTENMEFSPVADVEAFGAGRTLHTPQPAQLQSQQQQRRIQVTPLGAAPPTVAGHASSSSGSSSSFSQPGCSSKLQWYGLEEVSLLQEGYMAERSRGRQVPQAGQGVGLLGVAQKSAMPAAATAPAGAGAGVSSAAVAAENACVSTRGLAATTAAPVGVPTTGAALTPATPAGAMQRAAATAMQCSSTLYAALDPFWTAGETASSASAAEVQSSSNSCTAKADTAIRAAGKGLQGKGGHRQEGGAEGVAGLPWGGKVEQLLGSCLGFQDPNLESSYGVFRSHSCSNLDISSFAINFTMLLVSCFKNFEPGVEHSWGKTRALVVYGLLFFFPYTVMLLHRRCYLRHRELLLAVGRALSALWLILVAVGWLHQPDAWMAAVTKTYSMQLQNAVILPGWQQLRLHSYLLVAVAHGLSDGCLLALAMPVKVAVMQSLVVQLTSLLVTMLVDAWGRARFLARYQGPCKAAALVLEGSKAGGTAKHSGGIAGAGTLSLPAGGWKGKEYRGVTRPYGGSRPGPKAGLKME